MSPFSTLERSGPRTSGAIRHRREGIWGWLWLPRRSWPATSKAAQSGPPTALSWLPLADNQQPWIVLISASKLLSSVGSPTASRLVDSKVVALDPERTADVVAGGVIALGATQRLRDEQSALRVLGHGHIDKSASLFGTLALPQQGSRSV